MEIEAAKDLKIGQIVEETLDVIERNALPLIAYVLVMVLVNGALAWFGLNYTSMVQQLGKSFIGFLIGVAAAFLVMVTMLRRSGLLARDADDSMLSFVLLMVLTALGVLGGFILVIFPGFYLMARWSIAQPLLLTRGLGPVEAMKASWELTSGSEFAILVVYVVLVVVQVGAGFAAGSSLGQDNLLGIAVIQTVSSLLGAIGMALVVALYRLIVGREQSQMAETFR